MEYITLRVKPNLNYGFWMIMCQCRFISCNDFVAGAGGVYNAGECACGGGVYGKPEPFFFPA